MGTVINVIRITETVRLAMLAGGEIPVKCSAAQRALEVDQVMKEHADKLMVFANTDAKEVTMEVTVKINVLPRLA